MGITGGQTPYSCSASGLPSGLTTYVNDHSCVISGTPTVASTFNVTVTVSDSSSPIKYATTTLTLVVSPSGTPAPTLSFTATPGSITSGQSSTLNWSSTNATSCTASGGWTGARSVSGALGVSPSTTTAYTLRCSGTGGSVTQSATVTVTSVDTTLPSIAISSPVATGQTYSTGTATVNVSGTASDNVGVVFVYVANNRGGSVVASSLPNWSATGIALQSGANILTAHAIDAAGNDATASITVNYTTADTGSLAVTVRRSDTNAPLSGATVWLSGGPSNPASQTTAADGTTFSSLVVGNYTVTASLAEFKTNSASATVVANTPTPVPVSLTPSQELTPPPQPPEPLVDTTGATTPTDRAVVITHGWHDDAKTWVTEMASTICKDLGLGFNGSLQPPVDNQAKIMCHAPGVSGGLGWDVWVKDWKDGANESEPWDAVTNATGIGEKLAFTLNKGNYQHIHFVAHSAGANLIETASRWLKVFRPTLTIHETFLDAYDPSALATPYGRHFSSYGAAADWADNYVDTRALTVPFIGEAGDYTDLFMFSAYNVDVTPEITIDNCDYVPGLFGPDRCRHDRPMRFYGESIDSHFIGNSLHRGWDGIVTGGTAGKGFPLSEERGQTLQGLKASYPTNTECSVRSYAEPTGLGGYFCQDKVVELPTTISILPREIFNTVVDSVSGIVNPVAGTAGKLYDSLKLGWAWVTSLAPQQRLAAMDSATAAATIEVPSYLVVNVTTTTPVNVLRFNWGFDTAGEGLLRVFVGGNLVREIDQRYVTPSSPETEEIYIGGEGVPLPPGTHRITFRFDGFASASGVELTDVELGVLTTPLAISTANPPIGEVGASYAYGLQAEGGLPPYTWSLVSSRRNKLPRGFTLTAEGTLTGIPTQARTTPFAVQVTDAAGGSVTRNVSLQVVRGVKLKTKRLASGAVGVPYVATLQATGGIPPLVFSLVGGALPPGLTLDPGTGLISGTPTAAGTFDFQVRVTSSGGSSDQKGMRITIK